MLSKVTFGSAFMEITEQLANYLDKDHIKVKSWPAKDSRQTLVLEFLADKFEMGRIYTEKEVNQILNDHHTFGDPALLRRELYIKKFLDRELDGSKYWKA